MFGLKTMPFAFEAFGCSPLAPPVPLAVAHVLPAKLSPLVGSLSAGWPGRIALRNIGEQAGSAIFDPVTVQSGPRR